MKTANIALFKQFLKENGANKIFCGMYRQYPFPDNPPSVEDYLKEVDSDDVITNAFKFPPNLTTFGPDYWLDLAVKWEHRKASATEDGGQYHTSSKNRIERQAAKPLEVWEGPMFKKNQPEPKHEPKPSITPRPNMTEEQMALSGFKFFEFNQSSYRRLLDGYVSVNCHKGFRMTFNREVSVEIQKSKLKYFRIAQKGDEKALFVVFTNEAERSMAWRVNGDNVVFSCKELIVRILDFFGLKGEYNQLRISKNMANNSSYLTYKLTNIK